MAEWVAPLCAAVSMAVAALSHNKRLGRWCRSRSLRGLRRRLDASAAERWRLLVAMQPGPDKDRCLRLSAAVAGHLAEFEDRTIEGEEIRG